MSRWHFVDGRDRKKNPGIPYGKVVKKDSPSIGWRPNIWWSAREPSQRLSYKLKALKSFELLRRLVKDDGK